MGDPGLEPGTSSLSGSIRRHREPPIPDAGPPATGQAWLRQGGRLSSTIWEQTIALADDGRSYESVASATQPQTLKERQRLSILHDAGDAGVTAGEFAALAGFGDDAARRVLGEFAEKGWATEDEAAWPRRWRSTGEGLNGPVDLLGGRDSL